MLVDPGPLCLACKHFRPRTNSCPAFPEGIPEDILCGLERHDSVIAGQKGAWVFTPAKELKRSLIPEEWIEKWITYKGRRIPIIKKEHKRDWRDYLKITAAIAAGAAGAVALTKLEARRLAGFLAKKGAKLSSVNYAPWQVEIAHAREAIKKEINPLERLIYGQIAKYGLKQGRLNFLQLRRTRKALETLESRFPNLVRDVNLIFYKMPPMPFVGGMAVAPSVVKECAKLAKDDAFWEAFKKKLPTLDWCEKLFEDKTAMRTFASIAYQEALKALGGRGGAKEGLAVALPAAPVAGAVFPTKRYVYHEFGHILHARVDQLNKFILEAYAPYVSRVLSSTDELTTGIFGLLEAERKRDKFKQLIKIIKGHRKVYRHALTSYSLTSPVEGFAEAFSFYIHRPKKLRQVWPEAYRFFEELEKRWGA